MAWTRAQQIVVALLPKFSSILSLFGSFWIIIEVITDNNESRRKRNHPYHRLLCAMSVYDVLESGWNFASSWPIPEGTAGVAWARGTTATCTAQGFFLTLSVAVPIYNAMLSLYYVLVINYRFSDVYLRRLVEPAMHGVAFVWSFGTATYAASTKLINNANLWCWIAPYPTGCLDSRRYGAEGNCERGDNAWIYQWAFYFAPLWLCIFMATACTTMVYRYVRSIDTSSLKYRHPERFSYLNTQVSASPKVRNSITSSSRRSVTFADTESKDLTTDRGQNQLSDVFEEDNEDGGESSNTSVRPKSRVDQSDKGYSDQSEGASEIGGSRSSDDDVSRLRKASDKLGGGRSGRGDSSVFSLTSQGGKSIRDVVGSWRSSRIQYRDDFKRTLEVYYQSLLFYLGTFYLTHVWSTSNRIVQFANEGETIFALTAIHSLFDPLQGFLNYFVYQRPRYLKIRKDYPKAGRLSALFRMLRFSFMPEPQEWADQEVTTEPKNESNQMPRDDSGVSSSSVSYTGTRIGTRMTFAGVVSSLASNPSEADIP